MSNRISIARKRLGLTQAQLAFALGVAPPTIQRYESGYYAIPPERWKPLAAILAVPLEWLRGDVGTAEGYDDEQLLAFRLANTARETHRTEAEREAEIEDAFERAKKTLGDLT